MRDDSFCARPGNCPLQGKCQRNIHNWKVQPPIRIYEHFRFDPVSGCKGFTERRNPLQVAKARAAGQN